VLLVNIHKLQIVLAQSVTLAALEDQVENIRSIFRLDCQDILVLGCSKDFREGGKVNTEGDIAITSIRGEGLSLEHHGHKRDVGVVHCLERDTGIIAVEVAVLDEIFDRIDDLLALEIVLQRSMVSLTFFNRSACSRRASNTKPRSVFGPVTLLVLLNKLKVKSYS